MEECWLLRRTPWKEKQAEGAGLLQRGEEGEFQEETHLMGQALQSSCKVRAERCPADSALWGLRMMAENGFTGNWKWLSEQG